MITHSNHEAQSPIRLGSRAYFKGLGSSRILDALSCYLSLIVTQNWFSKSTADQNLEGRAPLAPPPGSATDHVNSLQNIKKEIIMYFLLVENDAIIWAYILEMVIIGDKCCNITCRHTEYWNALRMYYDAVLKAEEYKWRRIWIQV